MGLFSILEKIKSEKKMSLNHWRYRLLHYMFRQGEVTSVEGSSLPNFLYTHYCPLFHLTNILLLIFLLILPFILIWKALFKTWDMVDFIFYPFTRPFSIFFGLFRRKKKEEVVVEQEKEDTTKRDARILWLIQFSQRFMKSILFVVKWLIVALSVVGFGFLLHYIINNITTILFSPFLIGVFFCILMFAISQITVGNYSEAISSAVAKGAKVAFSPFKFLRSIFDAIVVFVAMFYKESCPKITLEESNV